MANVDVLSFQALHIVLSSASLRLRLFRKETEQKSVNRLCLFFLYYVKQKGQKYEELGVLRSQQIQSSNLFDPPRMEIH